MRNLFSPSDIVRSGLCIGCGSCVALSREQGSRMRFDSYGQYKPSGPREWFRRKNEIFTRTCPFSPLAKNEDDLSSAMFSEADEKHSSLGRYLENYVGHVSEDDFRMQGSSGGLTSWIAAELFRRGMIDGLVHVVESEHPSSEGRYFKFHISRSEEEIRRGARSRYYPVELSEALKIISGIPGRYAIVSVPCMTKAVQLLRHEYPLLNERIRFLLGLFCGHMKSSRFAESFAWQMKVPFSEVEKIEFRKKITDRPASWYNAMLTLKDGTTVNRDWWHLKDGDWGAGFFMNNACNYCDDVVAETADISFGDAWVEPYSSDGKGTNVAVVRSPLILKIIEDGILGKRLVLEKVSAEFVEQTQAAGLRQRREGLSWRLTWLKMGVKPLKRVRPTKNLEMNRKIIYWMRFMISKWSHRMFLVARITGIHHLYTFWARIVISVYYGVAYHKSSLGKIKKRFAALGK